MEKIKPDVEVVFDFIGTRKTHVVNGYRPAHLVKDNYLTTGVHHYYDTGEVSPNGTARGTITFIMPEAHPTCLWVGKRINIQEGSKIVGYATITKIFNSILDNTTL
jgi:elongation factor Tu